MKYLSRIAVLISALFTLGMTACSSDDDDDDLPAKPVITLTEVGHDNSCHAHPGSDLHLEATVLAEGLIQRVDVEIHQEEGGTFEIETAYTDGKYIGVRNIEFHEHIDIPANAPLGDYHLHFTVTDKHGQQTTAEQHLHIVEDDGEEEEDHDHE
ncbi:MAG: DUF4625 domain-containing protein [Prevotella sp.]|nr:DUF4625 domain-containing protein [Prevotella sp.]